MFSRVRLSTFFPTLKRTGMRVRVYEQSFIVRGMNGGISNERERKLDSLFQLNLLFEKKMKVPRNNPREISFLPLLEC